MTNSTVVKL